MEIQKTTLYNYHKNLGAKFVSFAGYEMPIQYSEGIVKEHISTRTFAGFFDVSHMGQFYISGKNIEEALEKIIPTDLKGLKVNQSKYSFLLNDKGGVIDDLIITRREKGSLAVLNNEILECNSKNNLKIVDLTGAGDLFAAGFLHGYINSLSIKDSLEKGTEMSSKVIQKIGARI